MNITFVLGNGFDKAFGLATGYGDFYKWYIQQLSQSDLISNFKKIIEKNENDTWADFEKGLGEYSNEFTLENIDDFFTCYQDAQTHLIQYLTNQEQSISVSDEDKDVFEKSIINFEKELTPAEIERIQSIKNYFRGTNTKYNFLSLNYTYLIDNIIDYSKAKSASLQNWTYNRENHNASIGTLVHAHGYSDKWPILGVDNDSQFNKDLISNPYFERIMIKSEAVDIVGEAWTKNAISMIDESNIICVFGASIGETDSRWWKRMMSWLNGERKLLILFYYDKDISKNTISIYDKMFNENKIKNKLISYANEEIRNTVSSKILVITNTENVFNFRNNNEQ